MEINIPKNIILNKDIDENRIMVYIYFAIRSGLDNVVGYSCDDVVTWCGYIPDNHKGRISEKIYILIELLDSKNYISKINNIFEKRVNSNVYCKALFHKEIDYVVKVDLLLINKIIKSCYNANIKNYNSPSKLLLIYLYLQLEESKDKTNCEVSIDIGLSEKYIKLCIESLSKLELISSELNNHNNYYIYKFVDINDEIIYIGKSKNILNRISQHFKKGHLQEECYTNTKKIYYHAFNTQMDMDVYEIYYINKYLPKYNTEFKPKSTTTSDIYNMLTDIEWNEYKFSR